MVGCGKQWKIEDCSEIYICGENYNTYLIKGRYLCPHCKEENSQNLNKEKSDGLD